ncbi:MAG: hypothetical protein ABUS79_31580, partial [Pseudomonadota bacterium]
MSRAAAVLLLAAFGVGLGACRVKLSFDPPDAGGGCATDRDCPLKTLHCDPLTGACFACVSNTDCVTSARPVCEAALHICVECGADQDCAAGSTCVKQTRSCVRACAVGTDCAPAGSWCDDGLCAQCDDDHECTSAGAHCDPATFQCTSCVTDAHCTTPAAP